jgi:hypothetical protein
MADGTGARAVSISDGGLTGPAFFEIEALTGSIADAELDDPETWLPPEDPHRRAAA